MAQYQASYPQGRGDAAAGVNWFAWGMITFAAILMIVVGSFHFIAGIAALVEDDFYIIRPGYDLRIDVTAWGWFHMIGGIIVAVAGFGLFSGSLIARVIAITLAAISALWSFYSIPYYPVWSILIIALDVVVIWAIAVHGGDYRVANE